MKILKEGISPNFPDILEAVNETQQAFNELQQALYLLEAAVIEKDKSFKSTFDVLFLELSEKFSDLYSDIEDNFGEEDYLINKHASKLSKIKSLSKIKKYAKRNNLVVEIYPETSDVDILTTDDELIYSRKLDELHEDYGPFDDMGIDTDPDGGFMDENMKLIMGTEEDENETSALEGEYIGPIAYKDYTIISNDEGKSYRITKDYDDGPEIIKSGLPTLVQAKEYVSTVLDPDYNDERWDIFTRHR